MGKMTAHRVEPANEGAVLASKAISDPKLGPGKWARSGDNGQIKQSSLGNPVPRGRINVFQHRHPAFNNSVRDVMRSRKAENEMPKHQEKLTGACKIENK